MTLGVDVRLRRGDFRLDTRLEIAAGEVTALIGPNGAGKTTLLDVVAGLVEPDAGRIAIDGRTVFSTRPAKCVAAHDRRLGVVFQDLALFPNLRVVDNVAFGIRTRTRSPRGRARRDARHVLARLGIEALADRRPDDLSGGQAQRVALARALAGAPRALLLDEPLAAIDAAARPALRHELRRHLDAFEGATLLVTHDPVDVATVADSVAVIEAGRITQRGSVDDLRRRPRSEYVAELIGVNLLSGTAKGTAVDVDGGGHIRTARDVAGRVLVAVHPHAVSLHTTRPHGTPRNVWPGVVAAVEAPADASSDRVRVRVDAVPPIIAEVTRRAVAELDLEPGRSIWSSVKATEVDVYPDSD